MGRVKASNGLRWGRAGGRTKASNGQYKARTTDYQIDFTFLGCNPPFSETNVKSSLQSGPDLRVNDSPSRPRIGVERTGRDPAAGKNGFFCGDGGPWMRLITPTSQPKFEFKTFSIQNLRLISGC